MHQHDAARHAPKELRPLSWMLHLVIDEIVQGRGRHLSVRALGLSLQASKQSVCEKTMANTWILVCRLLGRAGGNDDLTLSLYHAYFPPYRRAVRSRSLATGDNTSRMTAVQP